ncbi:PREDICTED: uncharacterized protein LOC106818637, partial [Priapulus caudatus]|uniref:Uncharacterized protein LOC106818637 n=1 Tax=Priapulus caudatus TaxID=37621 RepID=A0ABM1F2Z1_PRICU
SLAPRPWFRPVVGRSRGLFSGGSSSFGRRCGGCHREHRARHTKRDAQQDRQRHSNIIAHLYSSYFQVVAAAVVTGSTGRDTQREMHSKTDRDTATSLHICIHRPLVVTAAVVTASTGRDTQRVIQRKTHRDTQRHSHTIADLYSSCMVYICEIIRCHF